MKRISVITVLLIFFASAVGPAEEQGRVLYHDHVYELSSYDDFGNPGTAKTGARVNLESEKISSENGSH